MLKRCCALFLISGALWAQPSRDQGRRADLDFVGVQLPKLQANFFSQLSPADYTRAVAALDAQIPTLTDAEFYIGLARLAAMAGDDHTYVRLDDAAAVSAGFQQLPLRFRWLDDGLFVIAATSEYSRALGTKVVRVGDISVDEVMRRIGTVIPHFNSQRLHFVASDLRSQQMLQGLDIVPATPNTPYTFQALAGDEFTLDVSTASEQPVPAPATDQGTLPEYLQNTNQNYWFTYSAALRLLYFKYNKCTDDPVNPFAAVVTNFLNTFDANPVDTLVIDLRGNNGGDPQLLNSLTDGLILRIPAFLKNPNFRVYVPIDKGTFSGASDDAMIFKTPPSQYGVPVPPGWDPSKVIRVIGEPTSEAPAHAARTTPFTLSYSKLDGEYAIAFSAAPPFIAADYDTDGPSFGPDIAVPTRSTDYFARHDPVLAAILARFEGAPPAPTGTAIAVNGASLRVEQGLAPGSFASVLGTFPAGVDGVQVNGQDGQVVAATQSQVDFVIPSSVSPGPATISVRSGSNEVANGQATITPAGPGIFVRQPTDPSQPGMVLNEDSSVNGSSAPAAAGSVLQIFATGIGPDVQVFLGGVPASVLSSAPTDQPPGGWQITARVPDGLSGQVPLFITTGNIASNGVTVWVQ